MTIHQEAGGGRAGPARAHLTRPDSALYCTLSSQAAGAADEALDAARKATCAAREELDAAYLAQFGDQAPTADAFAALGRSDSAALGALCERVAEEDAGRWEAFQGRARALRLALAAREAAERDAGEMAHAAAVALRALGAVAEPEAAAAAASEGGEEDAIAAARPAARAAATVVLVAGFEAYNKGLYTQVAADLKERCPALEVLAFSDRDLSERPAEVEAALARADCFFSSLVFDFDEVEWLRERAERVPVRLVFESAYELMSLNRVGSFEMKPKADGSKAGPPAPVKAILSKFGGGREEDKLAGYLSFLKIGPKLLRWVPGKKARDLRNWLTAYAFWNQGGERNVASMLVYLAEEVLGVETGLEPDELVETPALGLWHPAAPRGKYFERPREYLRWHREEYQGSPGTPKLPLDAPVVAVILYRKHVITKQGYIWQLLLGLERKGLRPLPVFINGVEAHTVVRDLLTTEHEQAQRAAGLVELDSLKERECVAVDAIVSTVGFPLVGGPAGSLEGARQIEVASAILKAKNVPYVVAAPLLIQDVLSWTRSGVAGLQQVVLYALPELDGAVDTVPLGALSGDKIVLLQERVDKLADRLNGWIGLAQKPAAAKKVAIMVYGFPPGVGATGTAALLNVPKSLERALEALRAEGFDLGPLGGDVELEGKGELIVGALEALGDPRLVAEGRAPRTAAEAGATPNPLLDPTSELCCARVDTVPAPQLREWLEGGVGLRDARSLLDRVETQWGPLERYRGIMTDNQGSAVVGGLQIGSVFIGVQPLLGVEGDPMRLLFERDLTPHPQYVAYYNWLEHVWGADAYVHFGMHGTAEWLPGSPLGNTADSWSDALMGGVPNVYVYAANNPSESIVAKRRGYGTIVSHNVPPYGRAGLYKQLNTLRDLLSEYREDPVKNDEGLRGPIAETALSAGLERDCPFDEGIPDAEFSSEVAEAADADTFGQWASRMWTYLQVVETRLFSEGLHTLGVAPGAEQVEQYLEAYMDGRLPAGSAASIAHSASLGAEELLEGELQGADAHAVGEAVAVRDLLRETPGELEAVLKALRGEYVPSGPGGDLLRDGPGVLPTGRNIFALDPYRMPSPAATKRGEKIAAQVLEQELAASGGAFPETVTVTLWGLDAIKTRGESVAIVLALVGARVVLDGLGKVGRFELIPLSELGRPRVDVLCSMSGIFRDSFANVVDLLDDLFQRAAAADEPEEMNFVRKHALALAEERGMPVQAAAARLFSNPAGDYGSMVNERVGQGNWGSSEELGDTWAGRNAFSYGRGGEKGVARPEVLGSLLQSTRRVVQEIDSVEYGLTDIQEYYANTGAIKAAAEGAQGGRRVGLSVVEATGQGDQRPKELEDVLRLEYRTKLLNPKWAKTMVAMGSGGAYEVSTRMTAAIGWGGTAKFAEDFVFDQADEVYVQDEEMAAKLRRSNPSAFRNVVGRLIEASGRGLWDADPERLERLREIYQDVEDELEGVTQ